VQSELGIGQEHGQLGPCETLALGAPPLDLGRSGQELEPAVEASPPFQHAHQPFEEAEIGDPAALRQRDRQALEIVVAQDQAAHLLRHLGQQPRPCLLVEAAVADGRRERDLDVHLDVGRVHPGRVVDGVGVEADPVPGGLDAAALGHAEIGAFADHLGPQVRPGDADGVVGAVAGRGLRLLGGADIGPDAAEEEEPDRRLQDRPHKLVRRRLHGPDAEHGLRLGRDRDRLGRAREHAAARRDQRLVVIGPARTRQLEQALALDPGPLRIGVRVQENVAMVEGGDELHRPRQEHAVAEDVAGHVADARDRHGLALDVDLDFAEVPLHGLPGAAGRDAHLLVVVAVRAAGREGVAEPVALLGRDGIRRVRKRGRALVGRNHEVGVVPVMAHDLRRRHDAVTVQIVRHVEQRADEDAVGLRALRHPGRPVRGRRKVLGEEPTFRANRHDHGVLDLLRLHEAQDFRAEILRPVGPADAAARHLAEAQMQRLQPRRVHEDLEERARTGQLLDLRGLELERDGVDRQPVLPNLEEVRSHAGFDEVQEPPQDAVLLEARHLAQKRFELPPGLVRPRRALHPARIEAGIEQRHELPDDRGMARQDGGQVFLPVRDDDLPEVAAEGPHQGRLAPAEPGHEHELVEAVRFRHAPEDGEEGGLDPKLDLLDRDRLPGPPARAPCRAARCGRSSRPARCGRSAR
jgi:hypothetical protein